MFRRELPRMYEIIDQFPVGSALEVQFRDFEKLLGDSTGARREFLSLEEELQQVDDATWNHLKEEVAELLQKGAPVTKWRQVMDRIRSEVKGYVYLARMGCKEIMPVPRGQRRTPDWQGVLDDRKVFCEVKTINTSDQEMEFRKGNRIRCPNADTGTSWSLSDGFLKQLEGKIRDAEDQLKGFDDSKETRRVAFVVLNFDDTLSGHVDLYFKQIQEFLCRSPISGISIVCYGKTALGEGQLAFDWHESTICDPQLNLTMF